MANNSTQRVNQSITTSLQGEPSNNNQNMMIFQTLPVSRGQLCSLPTLQLGHILYAIVVKGLKFSETRLRS